MASRAEHANRPGRESLSKRLGRRVAAAILARGGHACAYCASTAEESGAPLQLDHLRPRAVGGTDTADNLVVACRSCNSARQATPLATWCRQVGVDVSVVRAQARRVLREVA